jgi:hypothetical protein
MANPLLRPRAQSLSQSTREPRRNQNTEATVKEVMIPGVYKRYVSLVREYNRKCIGSSTIPTGGTQTHTGLDLATCYLFGTFGHP